MQQNLVDAFSSARWPAYFRFSGSQRAGKIEGRGKEATGDVLEQEAMKPGIPPATPIAKKLWLSAGFLTVPEQC